jgi:hypothetical protein
VTDRPGIDDFFGVLEPDGICEDRRESLLARLSVERWRVLPTGKAGRGPVGGGRGDRGMVEVIVEVIFV